MLGGEAYHFALATLRDLGEKIELVARKGDVRGQWTQGRKVIFKNERGCIGRVSDAIGSGIARTEITGGLVLGNFLFADRCGLLRPRATHSLGRNQNILISEGIFSSGGDGWGHRCGSLVC